MTKGDDKIMCEHMVSYLPAAMDNAHHDKYTHRAQFIGMWKAGKNISEIARETGVTRKTVRRWVQRYQESGRMRDAPRPGRPRVTSTEDDARILAHIRDHPFTNAAATKERATVDSSLTTIRRRLHKEGLHHRVPAVKEKLTAEHRAGRLRFAEQYVDKDLDFWARVIFSDETTFYSHNHGRLHCWRPNNTRYDPTYVYQQAKSGHVTLNMWGWINLNSIGELTEIHGRFTADQYMEILEEVMLPTVRAYTLPYPETIVFMQASG